MKIVNHNLLSLHEIELVNEILGRQGITSELLDEALTFATTTIRTNGDIILYTINIPNFSNQTYQHLRIEAIISESERIKLKGNEYLYHDNELFLKLTDCNNLGNWTMCYPSELENVSNDHCLPKIIRGLEGSCSYESITQHIPVIEMSTTTLLFNDVNGVMHTNCGIADRELVGSFLVSYQNCSVSMETYTYTNQIVETIPAPLFVPSINLKVIKENVERVVTIHAIEKLHHDNLNHLKHLNLITETHQWV